MRTMGIDAKERHMKRWFGDQETWSHEKLRSFIYDGRQHAHRLLVQLLIPTVECPFKLGDYVIFPTYVADEHRPNGPAHLLIDDQGRVGSRVHGVS